MIEFELRGFLDSDSEFAKTSFSIFVAILYIKVLYILVMTLYVLIRIKMPGQLEVELEPHNAVGVDFLYRNYKQSFKGAVLNEPEDMNMPRQVCRFFQLIRAQLGYLVLVICSDFYMNHWHFHLSNDAGFQVVPVDYKTDVESLAQITKPAALLLKISDLKLAENLLETDFSVIAVDNFDTIAHKLVFKRLEGKFNIGLSSLNFYMHPNQKQQWAMMNWTNPGRVGKQQNFQRVDNDNFVNWRDNYRRFWLRLTWDYCDSFIKPSEIAKEEYEETVRRWMTTNGLEANFSKKSKSRKTRIIASESDEDETDSKLPKIIRKRKLEKPDEKTSSLTPEEIKLEVSQEIKPENLKLPVMDESPILTSIIKNFEKSPEPIRKRPRKSPENEHDDILLDIIKGTGFGRVDEPSPSCSSKKNEKEASYESSDDFLRNLFVGREKSVTRDDDDFSDIDRLLAE